MVPIIDKINALLNQTEAAGCTQAEAETAFKMAQQLMTKYRISKADVGLDEDHDREKIHNEHTPLYTGKRVITWKAILASAICNANGCRLYYEYGEWTYSASRRVRNVYFKAIGRDSDVVIVQQLYNYLVKKVETMSNAQLAVRKRNGVFTGKNWTNSFKMGAAQTLAQRVMAGEKEARDEADPTALVVLDKKDEEVKAWENKHMKLGKRKLNYTRINPAAYSKGSKASKRIAIQ